MSLKDKLDEIDQLQQAIEKHGKLDADVLKKVNYKFRLEWNYYSNRMEGNTLTMEETKTVMVNQLDVRGKPLKDVLEMKGHDDVVRNILQIGKGELNISETRVKDLHTGIMYGEGENAKEKIGRWKTVNNHIINLRSEKFDFTDQADVATEMHGLINWINAEKEKIQRKSTKATHPVLLAFQFHLKYLTIHPFYDGNGRTARILTNLILISYGFPPIYIKDGAESEKYYSYLSETQAYGADETLLFGLLADSLIRSLNIVLNAAEGKEIDEPDDIDKRIALLTKELSVKQIVNSIKSNETIYN